MTLQILRTASSGSIRDGMDFSTALCDADGRLIAQGLSIAVHLGSIPDAMDAVLARHRGSMHRGDIFILNDPYHGGMHLPDIFLMRPIYNAGRVLAFAVIVADQADVGGMVPGSRPVEATEIYQEGFRIPPMRLMDRGRPVEPVWDFVAANSRVPDKITRDLRSALGAMEKADDALQRIASQVGRKAVTEHFRLAMDYSERVTRAVVDDLPDGTYSFRDSLDALFDGGSALPICVSLEVGQGRLRFSFEGTAAQVPASINSTMSFTKSCVYAAVRTLLPADAPNNAGMHRVIEVTAPTGSIVNASEPAPVASRGVTGARVVDTVLGVLAHVAPDRIPAAGEGGMTSVRIGGRKDDANFVAWDSIGGTWGGRPIKDGIDGCSNFSANTANMPIEVLEAEFPLLVRRYGLRQDSGGPGRWRGGLGIEREWELLAPAVFSLRSDRATSPPWGLRGGHNGEPSLTLVAVDDSVEEAPPKFARPLPLGARVRHMQAGGGGFGDPLMRDPSLVAADVQDEKVSVDAAREIYGVVIDEAGNPDPLATAKLRAKLTTSIPT